MVVSSKIPEGLSFFNTLCVFIITLDALWSMCMTFCNGFFVKYFCLTWEKKCLYLGVVALVLETYLSIWF